MNINVLLIDDERDFISAVSRRLGKRGVSPRLAFSGEQGLEALKGQQAQVVVLDMKMPGMNGMETLKRIKAEYPLTEVILLTAHATVDSALEGMKLGAFDYLLKPCELDTLVDTIRQAAEKRQAQDERIMEARQEQERHEKQHAGHGGESNG